MTRNWIHPSDEAIKNIEYKLALKTGDQNKLNELATKGFVPNTRFENVSDFSQEEQDIYFQKFREILHNLSTEKLADEIASMLGVTKYDREKLVNLLRVTRTELQLHRKYGEKLAIELGFYDEHNSCW